MTVNNPTVRHFLQISLLVAVTMCSMSVVGEPVYMGSGEQQQLSLEDKIAKSSGTARLAVIGSFAVRKGAKVERYSDDEAFVWVQFNVDTVVAGDPSLRGRNLELKLPIVIPRPADVTTSRSIATAQLSAVGKSLEKLERDLENKTLTFQAYEHAVYQQRESLVHARGYPADFLLIPLRVGGIDFTYRAASVPIVWGESYVLFLLRDRTSETDETPFSPWELDIYPSTDTRVMQALKKSDHHSPP